MSRRRKEKAENIWNLPNTLTFIRVIITFITIYFIFAQFPLLLIAILFTLGMITDFLDGQIAKRFNLITEFGRKADMIADRFLWIGTALAFLIAFGRQLIPLYGIQLLFTMSREIISMPFALIAFFTGKGIP